MQTGSSPSVCRAFLGCQLEKVVDELNLTKKIISCHPSSLPLPDHVDCFIALNRSPSRPEFSEALLGVHSTFRLNSRQGTYSRRNIPVLQSQKVGFRAKTRGNA